MKISNYDILEQQADLCSTMAHAKRLAILEVLKRGEASVGELADALGSSISAVSQHLRIMRDKEVVLTRRDGRTVYYRLSNLKIAVCCAMVREVLLEGLIARGRRAEELDQEREI
ncbi:helix-turn-helix transcriptional regulator [Candidatus Fermentibacteria bacterium]|nr:helix-turn-helix transcriptional regulator [Candidatus Fermentibacteria bacterium]